MDEARRKSTYSVAAGVAVAAKLAAEGRFIFTTDDARRVAADLGMPSSGVGMMLSRLTGAGWIKRLRRGLYAGTGRVPGGTDIPELAVATALVQPSAISLWSALSFHDLTTQVPLIVMATAPRKVTAPSMRATGHADSGRMSSGKHGWRVDQVEFTFMSVRPDRFFGIENVWIDQFFRVPIMDRERTVLDLIACPRFFGGLDTALATLDENWRELDLPRLVDYAIRYDSKGIGGAAGVVP